MRKVNSFEEYRFREMTDEELEAYRASGREIFHPPLPLPMADEDDIVMFPMLLSGRP